MEDSLDFGWVATLSAFLQPISDILWGWPTVLLLLTTGLYMLLLLGGIPLRRLPYGLWQVLTGPRHDALATGHISNRAALWMALAATIGTGNIAGVATAITLGGPGAVFWMWVSGLLGISLKYAEATLGVYYRQTQPNGEILGGPMLYLKQGARMPTLAWLYGLALGFAALSVGGMVQSNSMADVMATSFGIEPTTMGVGVAVVVAAVMLGGLKRIADVANIMVPFAVGVFLLAGCAILLFNATYIPHMFGLIFTYAWSPAAAGGGFAGAAVAAAMRYGLARGMFSNESGLGTAAIVAAAARTRHPAEQGFIAMTQTCIDTLVVCTFTALVILVSGAWQAEGLASGGAALSAFAFDAGLGFLSLGEFSVGGMVISFSLILFAFTTILGWGYYGQQGAVYALGRKAAKPYLYVYIGLVFFGAAVLDMAPTLREGVALVWLVADITVALMLIPNLIGLLMLAPMVQRLTRDWLRHLKTGERLHHPAFHEHAPAQPLPVPAAPLKAPLKTPQKAPASTPAKGVKKPATPAKPAAKGPAKKQGKGKKA